MAVEQLFGNFTQGEALTALGIPDARSPMLAAIAALDWTGHGGDVLTVLVGENGWELATFIGLADGDFGDITVSSSTAVWTIDNDAVTNPKLANMAQATIKGRADAAGTGDPTDLTASQVLTILGGTTGTGALVRAADPAITGSLNVAGIRQNGSVITRVENTAGARPTGSTGQGLELSSNLIQSWNVTGSAYGTFNLDGLTLNFRPSGSTRATVDAQGITAVGSIKPSSYTVATVPSAATHGAGAIIYVSNEAGGAQPAFSDATNWRRVIDRNVIS